MIQLIFLFVIDKFYVQIRSSISKMNNPKEFKSNIALLLRLFWKQKWKMGAFCFICTVLWKITLMDDAHFENAKLWNSSVSNRSYSNPRRYAFKWKQIPHSEHYMNGWKLQFTGMQVMRVFVQVFVIKPISKPLEWIHSAHSSEGRNSWSEEHSFLNRFSSQSRWMKCTMYHRCIPLLYAWY